MMPSALLHLVGGLLLVLFCLNFFLPRWFAWKTELPRLSLVNARIMRSHAIFIAIVILAMGLLCLIHADDLMMPLPLSRSLLAGLGIFWFLRLLAQWVLYDWSLWRGDRAKTIVQFVSSLLWATVSAVFAYAWWANVTSGRAG